MATRLYPANDQLESLLIEKFGKTTVENYYKFENWAESASLEELQAVSHLRDDDREYVIYKMRNRVEKNIVTSTNSSIVDGIAPKKELSGL